MKHTFTVLVAFLLALPAFAQNPAETAGIFKKEQRTFHCERYKALLANFDQVSMTEIREQIESDITGYTLLLQAKDLSFKEKRIFKENRSVLKKLLKYQDEKVSLRHDSEEFCKVAEGAVLGLAKGLGYGADGIMSVAAIPFQTVWKFSRSAITGKKKDGVGENQYQFLGPTIYGGTSSNLLWNDRYIGLAISQPWIIPLIAAPWIDSQIMDICVRKNSLNPSEERYCKRYIGFKDTVSSLSEPAEDAGVFVHNIFAGKANDVKDKVSYTQDEILKDLTKLNNENFCANMVKIGEKFRSSRKEIQARANSETWRLGTNPERYGIPAIADFNSSTDRIIRPQAGAMGNLRNVVVSLGSAPYVTAGIDRKAVLEKYKKNFIEFKKLARVGRKIFQDSDTVEKCEKIRKENNFDYEKFEAIASEVQDDEVGQKLLQSDVIKAQFKSKTASYIISGGTKMKWEFIENGDIETIDSLLRSHTVANIILVIHGTEKGKIIDSQMNEIPRTFFNNVSPSIMSINFFSCYSQKIDDYYSISKEFNSGLTYNALRHVSFVELDKTYSYQAGQVPMQSFGGYLSQVDLAMYHTTRGNYLYQDLARNIVKETSAQMCKVSVENLGEKKVTYSVTVNANYIGSVTAGRVQSEFIFDCKYLKDSDNKLRFLDIQVESDEALTLDQAVVTIVGPKGVVKLEEEDLTATKLNGNVLGILGTF